MKLTQLCVGTLIVLGLTQAPSAQAPAPSPQQVARAMVDAVKRYRPIEPYAAMSADIADAEKEILSASENRGRSAAQATAGESFGGMEQMQLIFVYRGWVLSRTKRPLTAEALAQYEQRIKLVDSATVQSWQKAKEALGVGPDQRTLLILAVAFHNDLWDGAAWKPNNPSQAMTRLQSIPSGAVGQLADAAGLPSALRFVAAYALLGVDSLFVQNAFQQARFDSALPLAKPLFAQ